MLPAITRMVVPTAASFGVLKGDAIRGASISVQWQRVPVLTADVVL